MIFVSGFILNRADACTIFSCAKNGGTFACANEDDYTPFTRVWFNPRTKERYDAYVSFVQGDKNTAKRYYQMASADPKQTYGISYNRAKEMLIHIP